MSLTIELWLLNDLDFANEDVLEGEDAFACIFNAFANRFGNELLHKVTELTLRCFGSHDAHHLLADCADLGRPGVAGALDLVRAADSSSTTKYPKLSACYRHRDQQNAQPKQNDVRLQGCRPTGAR